MSNEQLSLFKAGEDGAVRYRFLANGGTHPSSCRHPGVFTDSQIRELATQANTGQSFKPTNEQTQVVVRIMFGSDEL